jgi:hypothetical protein
LERGEEALVDLETAALCAPRDVTIQDQLASLKRRLNQPGVSTKEEDVYTMNKDNYVVSIRRRSVRNDARWCPIQHRR